MAAATDAHDPSTARPRGLALAGVAAALAVAALVGLKAAHAAVALGTTGLVGAAAESTCTAATVTANVQADSWIDEDSPTSTKGSDSILRVDGGSRNEDTGAVSGRARALIRFGLPAGIPAGCVLESATLRVWSSEESAGSRVTVARLASAWAEGTVTWSGQPPTVGEGATSWSRGGYMQWNVTAQVEAMLGTNHGFLLRDAAEASADPGEHGFYAREKGENPPRVVLTFAPPPSDEPPGEPAPPEPVAVTCGQSLTRSTLLTNGLSNCPGDGLVIDAPRIVVDLGGHTIDGVGLGSGVRNDGHDSVTIRNGTVQEFDHGVNLLPESELNVVESLTLLRNEVSAIELFDVAESVVRGNVLDGNGGGISLVSGTRDSLVTGNTITANGQAALFVRDSDGNRLADNTVSGGGDLGIGLERASGNTLLRNLVSGNSDGGIELGFGSHGNHLEANVVTGSGDHGILVDESDGNVIVGNTAHFMSDSGITLEAANDGVVRGNDVRFNTGGLQIDGSSRNAIEENDASDTSGIGIELGGGSLENALVGNVAGRNGSTGIVVADDAADPLGVPVAGLGNLLVGNVTEGNRSDGILVPKGGHTLTANVARHNAGWGINAASNSVDGGRNVAGGNGKPGQCAGVVCKVGGSAPETEIAEGPPAVTNSTSARFVFDGSDGTGSPSQLRFECRLDTSEWATCSSPRSYTDLAGGQHVFEVRATDAAGNADPTPARRVWTVDLTPPRTTIEGAPAAESASGAARFVFSADEPGATFACSLDGGPFELCASPRDYSGLSEGTHGFRVRATDAAGNVEATPASHGWTVDTVAPATTIDSGPPETTQSTSARFEFSAGEPGATFECALDDGPFAACTSPWDYSGLARGAHRFQARATDRAGNVESEAASYAWTILAADTSAPRTTILDRPPDPSRTGTATFSFVGQDDVTAASALAYACRLDGDGSAGFVPCSSPWTYMGLSDGAHTFEVRAIDEQGNADPAPPGYTWTIDTVPPETAIGSGPPASTNGTSAAFTFSASEPGSTFECSLDGGAFAACSSPQVYTGLAPGTHGFQVRATDPAGNTDATPAAHSWTIAAAAGSCAAATVTLGAAADSWLLQTSPSSNYGADSVLKVDSKAGANARALVRFALPPIPAGCRVTGARLRLFASSAKTGRTLEALRVAAAWAEGTVTWGNQPATTGPAVTVASGPGYREWRAAEQVEAMYASGNHGFLVRDATEGGSGVEQGFHSREKGTDNPPRLVITFGG